jgi:multiple sugar transport system substrate-binding protein
MFSVTKPTTGRRFRRSLVVGIAALGVAAVVLTGCSSTSKGGSTSTGSLATGVDNGTTLTMWTRAATQVQSTRFVKLYNSTHKNQVKLTVIPTDDYQAKVGAAAGSKSLPDLFASDIAFVPNYTSEGLFLDISNRIKALPFSKSLTPAFINAGTFDGKQYVIPHVMDLSVMFYNKTLFKQAGLDPSHGPATLAEFATDAKAIQKLGNGVSGTFFGGNCGGCLVFTWSPSIWADGGQIMNADGTSSNMATSEAKSVFAIYRDLYQSGDTAAGTKDETGATWTAPFATGKVGLMPMPASTLGSQSADTGVSPIPGLKGGESTFVGGDGIGISATSKHADAAWNFLAWSVSESAQLNVLAKNHDIVARTDLSNNKYAAQDPRVVTINKVAGQGVTPFSRQFGAAFNDPNGPWLILVRDAVFGDASKIDADNDALNKVLSGK